MSHGGNESGGAYDGGTQEAPASSSLDHALLESIFYSEMMLMDDSTSLISNNLLSTLAADGSVRQPPPEAVPEAVATPTTDSNQQSSVPRTQHQHQPSHEPPPQGHGGTYSLPGTEASAAAAPSSGPQIAANSNPTGPQDLGLPPHQPQPIHAMPPSNEVPESAGSAQATVATTNTHPLSYLSPHNPRSATGVQHGNKPLAAPELSKAPPVDATSVATAMISESDAEKRQKLVSQFATLASRLGIQLPETVVESLSTQRPGAGAATTIVATTAQVQTPTSQSSSPAQHPPGQGHPNPSLPPTDSATNPEVMQLAEAANAAVEAASRKRGPSDLDATSQGQNSSNDAPVPAGSTSSSAKQAPYSKRRKKPRLSDCEAKLAELQAENSMLKRHLANLSSQSHRLDDERRTQEQRMRNMLEQGAAEEELDSEVKHFQEVYSDYGRRRHQEVHFHLDQLQRLANPTNFTKLGLWTMGQQSSNSRNPIAGILQKELNISVQQGKKILEQRKRIQEVCSNLKECLGLLANLKKLCVEKTQIFHDRITRCREILTPRQVVKLIIWINEHTEVLDSVCPGWGSENISSKAPITKRT